MHWCCQALAHVNTCHYIRIGGSFQTLALQGPAPPREYAAAASRLPPAVAAEVAFAGLALETLEVKLLIFDILL